MSLFVIGTVVLDIAAFATGLTLCLFGKVLLEKGISGGFQGEGNVASNQFKIVTSSPGLVFAVAGLVVIGIAITKENRLDSVIGTFGDSSATAGPSLDQLAQQVSVRMLGSSSDLTFAQEKFEEAVSRAQIGDLDAARVLLSQAIVVQPELLRQALDSSDLEEIVVDGGFAEITRQRFAMIIDHPADLRSSTPAMASELLSRLRVHAMRTMTAGPAPNDVTTLVDEVPKRGGEESTEATLSTLTRIVEEDPEALVDLLEDPEYEWITNNQQIVGGLIQYITNKSDR